MHDTDCELTIGSQNCNCARRRAQLRTFDGALRAAFAAGSETYSFDRWRRDLDDPAGKFAEINLHAQLGPVERERDDDPT